MKALLIIALLALCSFLWINIPMPFVVPKGFPPPVYNFKKNPVTKAGFELGRKLFYDGRLSIDGNFPVLPAISSLPLLQLMSTG